MTSIFYLSRIENRSYINNLSIPYRVEAIVSDINFFDFVNQEDIVWLDGYTFDEDFETLRPKVFKLIETKVYRIKLKM